MLSEEDPLGLKEIYDPDGTDEAYSVRYVFSEQNNQDKPDGIILGNEQAVDGGVSIRDINNCLINNDSTTQEFKNIDLTLQQKNTFNELFDYVRMLEDVGGNVNPVFIFDEYLFTNDNPNNEVYIVEFTPEIVMIIKQYQKIKNLMVLCIIILNFQLNGKNRLIS